MAHMGDDSQTDRPDATDKRAWHPTDRRRESTLGLGRGAASQTAATNRPKQTDEFRQMRVAAAGVGFRGSRQVPGGDPQATSQTCRAASCLRDSRIPQDQRLGALGPLTGTGPDAKGPGIAARPFCRVVNGVCPRLPLGWFTLPGSGPQNVAHPPGAPTAVATCGLPPWLR